VRVPKSSGDTIFSTRSGVVSQQCVVEVDADAAAAAAAAALCRRHVSCRSVSRVEILAVVSR
jgi:hypothetical protein